MLSRVEHEKSFIASGPDFLHTNCCLAISDNLQSKTCLLVFDPHSLIVEHFHCVFDDHLSGVEVVLLNLRV